MSEQQLTESEYRRREVLAAAAGMATVGAAGYMTGRASAQSSPTGTFPVSSDPALLKLRADRLRLVPRSSDPSSPDNGTMWYNDSA